MKWIVAGFIAVVLAIATLVMPSPVFTSKAFASKMDGKGTGCSDGFSCMSNKARAASAKKGKKKP